MTVLYRAFLPELEIRAAAKGGDGRTVEGIAVPFGRPQRIHEDLVEQFARSSFNHQLAAMHRVHFSREHMSWGGTLLGRIHEARDDAAGLWVAMRVSATPAGDETLTLIEDQVLTELSVGFRERKNRTLPDGTIERTRADLTEVSIVLAGAYGQQAKVTGTRADEDALDEPVADEQDVEDAGQRERAERAVQVLAQLPVLPLL